MAVSLIAYPFRVSPTGAVEKVDDGSDEQFAQELAIAVLTRPGERPLAPEFGIADPVFAGFDAEALALHVDLFGPPVTVDDVRVRFTNETTQAVSVEFSS